MLEKGTSMFPTMSDTNQAVEPQKVARSFEFWIK